MDNNKMPVPLNRANIPPRFPVEYLPPVIEDFVNAVSENFKVYPEMPAAYSLAILSLCCQQKARIRATVTWAEELNLYVCIVAVPSEIKSPVFNTMIEPVREYVADYNKEHTAEIANMESTHLLRLITTDSTNEALIEMMEENNGSVGIMCDEGGIFQVAGGLYSDSQSNINCYLCGYDGQGIFVNRKTRNIDIPRATITMGVFCQKKVLADIMSNTSFTGKGLTQRFMYCMPESKVGSRTLIEPSPQKFIEARNAFAGYYSVIEGRMSKGGEYDDFHDYFGKLAGRTLRIAGLIHLAKYMDVNRPVDLETMTSAYVIMEYFAEQTKMVLGYENYNVSAEKLLEKLVDMCRKKHMDLLTVREINKKVRSCLSKEQFDDAVEELEIKGYIMHIMPEKNRYNNRNLGSYQVNRAWLNSKRVTIGQNP